MTKLGKNINQIYEDEVVSPTQYQMDQWIEAELAEATTDNILADEPPITLFNESNEESID